MRRRDALTEFLGEQPGRHEVLTADLRDPDAVEHMIESVARADRQLDVLVNSAGIFRHHLSPETSYDEWRSAWKDTLELNLGASANCSFCAARVMRRGVGGTIVNISSRGAFRGEPRAPGYGASKAAMNAMSQSLAVAWAADGIRVFALAPGFVETEMARADLDGAEGDGIRAQSPLGRVAAPDEVAYWAVAVCDPAAGFATGGIIDINGASYLRS